MKKTLETSISVNMKVKIKNAVIAVKASANKGDKKIIALEGSVRGMSLIIVAHSQALNLRFCLIHYLPYQQRLIGFLLRGHEFAHIGSVSHPNPEK